MKEKRPIVTVAALVFNPEGKFLLLKSKKWKGKWGIPAGKVEYGERTEEALKREIREETGLEIEKIKFLKMQELIKERDFWEEAHFVSINSQCRAENENVTLNNEAEEYMWAGPEEALKLDINRPTRELVEYFINNQK